MFIRPLLIMSGLLLLPLVIPVLPVEKYISYSRELGIKPGSSEKKELSELPQFYADMFGWKEKVRDVAKVYETLSEEDKVKCAVYSNNYGRCGAIDFFGKEFGLPKSIGSHNNYWLWGPRNYTGMLSSFWEERWKITGMILPLANWRAYQPAPIVCRTKIMLIFFCAVGSRFSGRMSGRK